MPLDPRPPRRARPCNVLGMGLTVLLVTVAGVAAQEKPHPATDAPLDSPFDWQVHRGSFVHALITNMGQVGSNPGTGFPWAEMPSCQWPGESGREYLWAGGWWLGALVSGTPHVTTTNYALEFRPGDSGFEGIYQSAAGAPGGNRFPDAAADDDGDGKIDEDWLDGLDNDGDGRTDEDFAAISDQMLTSVFTDTSASIRLANPQHVPLGLYARQAALGWGEPELDDFIALDLLLVNISSESLENPYVGFFADGDLGLRTNGNRAVDDRAGFWEGSRQVPFAGGTRVVDLSVGYMFDGDGDGGTTPGFIGFVFLGSEPGASGAPRFLLRNFRRFTGSQSFPLGGDPTDDIQRYSCLDGSAPQSLGPPGASPRPATSAAFDSDWRVLVSTGPFATLVPGDSLRLAMAMVLGDGLEDMLTNAARAKLLYEGIEVDCDGDGNTPEVCPVHWATPGSVSIGVDELRAETTAEGTTLRWHVEPATQRLLSGIAVQRGPRRDGPYETRTPGLLPPSATSYFDAPLPAGVVDDAGSEAWYRLALHGRDGGVTLTAPLGVAAGASPPATTLALPRQIDGAGLQLDFTLAAANETRLGIHDVSGRLVRTLFAGPLPAGAHRRTWDGRTNAGQRLARGLYLVRLESGRSVCTRKAVLLAP